MALLKYRLWDLDVVVKKALVAAVVVGTITAVSVLALLGLGGILVGPVSDQPGLVLVVVQRPSAVASSVEFVVNADARVIRSRSTSVRKPPDSAAARAPR